MGSTKLVLMVMQNRDREHDEGTTGYFLKMVSWLRARCRIRVVRVPHSKHTSLYRATLFRTWAPSSVLRKLWASGSISLSSSSIFQTI